ncbi:MAG: tRNA dihydrouridine synthase DusB [Elusimicrobiota bacterium]
MELKLKGLTLRTGVIQSPMAACTDLAFRLLAREMGMELAFAEMVSAHALVYDNRKTLELLKTAPGDRPLGAQLVGADPARMAAAAARIEEMGFDVLDLNLGCPAPKITQGGGGAGSALLTRPEAAGRIFIEVMKAVKRIPVTVKMRLGFADPSGVEAVEIGKRAEAAGICAVTVHGRTREQGYKVGADYSAIGRVKRALSIPVIGNGDVMSGSDAKRLVEVSRCDAVMLGRGALGNPWIYKDVESALKGEPGARREPTRDDRRRTLLRHLELEVRFGGECRALLHMRRIACWYFAGLPGAVAFRRDVCAARSTSEMRGIIEAFGISSAGRAPGGGATSCEAAPGTCCRSTG